MRISVKLRGRTEHIKEKKRAPPRVSDKYKTWGNNFLELHLARTYNDYSRASSIQETAFASIKFTLDDEKSQQ